MLYEVNRERNLYIPHQTYPKFDFDKISDDVFFVLQKKTTYTGWLILFNYLIKFICADRTVVSQVEAVVFYYEGFPIPVDIVKWWLVLEDPFRSHVISTTKC